MADKEKALLKCQEELEHDLDFLCVTGVEDKLQVDVDKTIEMIRQAGIQVWMLTGDKVETAKIIATSTGLKSKTQQMFEMTEDNCQTWTEVEARIN